MPVYQYSCNECSTSIEVNRSFNAKEIFPPCNMCGYEMSRVYGTVGIQFKGSGFYKTDNKSN